MATNALTYMKNVGKSVAYASVDVAKKMNPVFADLAETNSDITADTFKAIKNLKKNAKELPNRVMESQYGQFAKAGMKNIISDIQTGKFYNKERIARADEEAANNMLGSFDDFDFGDEDSGGEDDFDFSASTSDSGPSTNEMIDIVGEKTSTAVSTAVARSAEYIVQGTAEQNRAMYNQMNLIYGGLHSGMSTINKNISSILEFSTGAAATHFENSRTYYQEITRIQQENNALLKELVTTVKEIANPSKKEMSKDTSLKYSDITSVEGNIDIKEYAKLIKSNVKNKSGLGGAFDMLKMAQDMGVMETLIASPISGAVELALTKLVPNALEKSMKSFNESISGLFSNALMSLTEKGREKGGIWDTLAEMLGINSYLDKRIDPGKYEKGKVPFDGITRKAIVEVIPTYLAKILDALTGKGESRFDYQQGKFVTVDQLQEKLTQMEKDSARDAARGLDDVIRNKRGKLRFRSKEDENQFDKDWEAVIDHMFKNQKRFNTRDKNLSGKDFGLKGGAKSDLNIKIMQKLLDGTSENMKYADQLYRAIDSFNNRMRENDSSSVLNAMFNGSVDSSDTKPAPKGIVAKANDSVISELIAIHKELSYIRMYGFGGSRTKKKKDYNPPKFENFSVDSKVSQSDISYDKNVSNAKEEQYKSIGEVEDLDKLASEMVADTKDDILNTSKKKSFSQRMNAAVGLSGKMAVIVESSMELAKKPAKFIGAMFDKADERLYDIVYGPKEDKTGKKSFMGRLFKGMEKLFNKFSDFMTDSIIEPLKGKFTKEKIHDAARKFFGIFGIDMDEMVKKTREFLFGEKAKSGERLKNGIFGKLIDDTKNSFRDAFKWVKESFRSVGDWMGVTSKKNAKGLAKEKRNSERSEKEKLFKDFANSVATADEYATGMRRVNKTGLAVISEGEMVIPPDMNPFNIAKRRRNEKNVKKNLISKINNAFEYAEGTADGTSGNKLSKEEQELIKIRKYMDNPELLKAMEKKNPGYTKKIRERALELAEHYRTQKERYDNTDYEEGRNPFLNRMAENAQAAGSMIWKSAEGFVNISEKDKEKFQQNADKFIGNIKGYGGSMAAGGILGAGVSLMTGLIGGPLVGAAVGAGVGLLKKSEFLQNMLFGEVKDGERQGSKFISKELANNIYKYLPDMGKGATVGGILTSLPIVPGGPVAGIVIGSALGFAKNNDQVQKYLFGTGEEGSKGLFGTKEDFQKKVQSVLPKMGLGAVAGFLGGPFGMTANIVLGSALGFASDTNKFKDLMFGEEVDGKRSGGIFGAITKPAKEFFSNMYKEFKTFIKEEMFQPLADAIAPIKRQFEVMGETIADYFKNQYKEKIGAPLERFLQEHIMNPISKFLKGALGLIIKPIKFITSSPFKFIGAVGNALRTRQIKKGNASYMDAAQRNAFRRSRGAKAFAFGDRYAEVDQMLENASVDQVNLATGAMEGIIGSRDNINKLKDKSYQSVRKEMYKKGENGKYAMKEGDAKYAMSFIKAGSYEQAMTFIKNNQNIDEKEKSRLLSIISKESAKIKVAKQMKTDADSTIEDVTKTLEAQGIKLPKGFLKKLKKGDREAIKMANYFSKEQELRQGKMPVGKSLEKAQREGTSEIVKAVNEVRDLLAKINGVDENGEINKSSEYGRMFERQVNRNNNVSGLSGAGTGFIMLDSDGNIINQSGDIDEAEGESANIGDYARMGKYNLKRGIKRVFNLAGKGVKGTASSIKSGYKFARNTKAANYIFGDKNTDWRNSGARKLNPDEEVAAVSKDEVIISADAAKDTKGYSVGGIGGGDNKKNSFFEKIKDMANNLKRIAGGITGMAIKDGVDPTSVDENKDSDSYIDAIKNKVKKATNTVTQFVNGRVFKFRKDKNGDMELDKSSSENKESQAALEEEESVQKGILEGIKAIPDKMGSIFGKIFGNDKEEKKGLLSKLWDMLKTPLGVAAGGAILAGGAGYIAENYGDSIKNFWDNTFLPYFSDAWNGKKDGLGKFIYFFNPVNPDGLLSKVRRFFVDDFPGLMKTAASLISKGLNWALVNVLPGTISTMVQNLPIILKGVVKGVVGGLNALIFGNGNDGRPGSDEVVESALGKTSFSSFKSLSNQNGQLDWYDEATAGKLETLKYAENQISTSAAGIEGNKTETISAETLRDAQNYAIKESDLEKQIADGEKEVSKMTDQSQIDEKMKEINSKKAQLLELQTASYGQKLSGKVVTTDPLDGKTPRGINELPEAYREEAKKQYNKVKLNIIDTPYGPMTVGQILDSDKTFAVNEQNVQIPGYSVLMYTQLAKDLGMDIKLSKKQMDENTKAHGGGNGPSVEKMYGEGLARAGVKGLFGLSTGVPGGQKVIKATGHGLGKLISHIPFVGKPAGFLVSKASDGLAGALGLTNRVANKAGKLLGFSRVSVDDQNEKIREVNQKLKDDGFDNEIKEAKSKKKDKKKGKGNKTETSKATEKSNKYKPKADYDYDFTVEDADGNTIASLGPDSNKNKQLALPGVDVDGNTVGKNAASAAKDAATPSTKGKKGLGKLIDAASDNIKKFANKASEAVVGFLKDSEVGDKILNAFSSLSNKKKITKELFEAFCSRMQKGIMEFLAKYGGKAGAKAAAKIAAYTLSATIIMIADAVVSFASGCRNANSILGITEQPNPAIQVVCGIMEAINNVFLLGLVPLNLVVDLVIEGSKILGVTIFDDIDKQRQEAKAEVEEYNKKHGTNFKTVEEFNKKDRLSTKALNAAKKAGNWLVDKGKDAKDAVVEFGKGAVDKAKDAGNWVKEKAGNAKDTVVNFGKGALDKVKDAGNWLLGKGKDAKDAVVEFGKGAVDKAKDAGNWITGDAFNDAEIRKRFGMSEDQDITLQDRVSTFFGSKLSPLFGKDVTKEIDGTIQVVKEAIPKAMKGIDEKVGASLGMVDDEGNPLSLTDGVKFKLDETKTKLVQGWKDFKSNASEAWTDLKTGAKEKFNGFVSGSKKAFNDVNSNLGAALGMVDEDGKPLSLTAGIKYNWNNTKKNLSKGWKDFKSNTKKGWEDLKTGAKEKFDGFVTKSKKALSDVNDKLGAAFGMVDEDGKAMSLTVGAKYKWNKTITDLSKGWKDFKKTSKDWWNDVHEKASEKFEGFKENVDKSLNIVNDNLGAAFGMVDENGKAMSLTEGIGYNWDNFRKGVSDKWNDIKQGAANIWDKVTGFFDSAAEESAERHAARGSGIAGRGSGLYVGRGASASYSKMDRIAERSQNDEIRESQDTAKKTFISQLDSQYRNKKFNISGDTETQTVGDTGCAPAAAAMVINSANSSNGLTMGQAVRNSLQYKVKNDGVNATYFNDEFARHGVSSSYITSQNAGVRKQEIMRNLMSNNKVVLMGSDQKNTSKENSPYGPNPHYVVANGLSKDGKYIYINDPESNRPNIRYRTDKVLDNSELGIAAHVASGSGISSKIDKYIGRGSLPGSDVAEKCWNFIRSQGFSEEATAGLLGNFKQESGMRPDALQNGRGPAAGLFQMEKYGDYSSRWGKMAKFAKSRGKDWTDLESQLLFMIQEMPSQFKQYTGHGVHTYPNGTKTWWPEKVTVEEFKKLKDIAKAVEIFERTYERASIPRMEKRIQFAKEYYERFTGKFVNVGTASTSGDTSGGAQSQEQGGTIIDKIYGVFDGLAEAWGLKTSASTESSDSSGGTTSSGTNVSGNASGNVSSDPAKAEKQKSLVNKMYSMQGKLKYAQGNARWPGPRNAAGGISSDCSETVEYAYKSVLGVSPGGNSRSQRTDGDTYTVATSTADESKLQLGDLLLKSGHVEMYSGNGKMIGHGGPGKGPNEKPLNKKPGVYNLVRRWVGFRGSGSGLPVGRGSEITNAAYDNALRHIDNREMKSMLPIGYDSKEISEKNLSTMQYSKGKLSDSTLRTSDGKPVYTGRGTTVPTKDTITIKEEKSASDTNMIVLLLRTIVAALKQMVDNTGQLNEITKLIGDYISAQENIKSSNKQTNEGNSNLTNARQNLLTAINSRKNSSNSQNSELMELIELTERIAKQ